MWIHGFSVGLEYFDREEYGFGINCDLGIFRITWYKDLTDDGE
jgi:hypothetical protein